ncbi:MAG: HNH endonuclease [bacterium]|nr:HNH endonuclease [bacterium]
MLDGGSEELDIPWPDKRCIGCGNAAELTLEHLVPRSLGGVLTCRFLCKPCNDRFGQIESAIKADAAIRLAIDNLRPLLPDLWESMSHGQKFFTESEQGPVRGTVKNGVFRIDSRGLPDGTLLQSTDVARLNLRAMLSKNARPSEEIEAALERVERAPLGRRVNIVRGYDVTVRPVNKIQPALDTRIEMKIPTLKIAYEYLALHLGTTVLCPHLDPVRDALAGRTDLPDFCSVEPLRGKEYQPIHGLSFDPSERHATVLVVLFGWLIYRVHFHGIVIGDSEFLAFTFHLDSKAVAPQLGKHPSRTTPSSPKR